MSEIEAKLERMGLVLPPPLKTPPGLTLPFEMVLVRGTHVYISGHAPQDAEGNIAGPFGKVGAEVSIEEAYDAARRVAVSVLGDLKRTLGDLDRVRCWSRVLGMVNTAPGFFMTTPVVNGFSELIVELYGPERGAHTRSAVGMAALPLNLPVEVEAELEID